MTTRAAGFDLGNGYTKAVSSTREAAFPSIIAPARELRFVAGDAWGDGGPGDICLHTASGRWFVGDLAQRQSRFAVQEIGQSRLADGYYRVLFEAALTEALGRGCEVRAVCGLPIGWYTPENRRRVTEMLQGEHRLERDGKSVYAVSAVRVVPEPFGALLSLLLGQDGLIVHPDVAQQTVGVIDIGTKTTDFALFDRLEYIDHRSASIEAGLSDAQAALAQHVQDRHGIELSLREADQAMRDGYLRVYGDRVDLSAPIAQALAQLAERIAAKAMALWDTGASVDRLALAGGGAPPLSAALAVRLMHRHLAVVEHTFWANVRGFYRWGLRESTWG